MDATLKLKAEQLAGEFANQAQSLDDLNGLIRTLMKSALERMLDTEMDVHLGRKTVAALPQNDPLAWISHHPLRCSLVLALRECEPRFKPSVSSAQGFPRLPGRLLGLGSA